MVGDRVIELAGTAAGLMLVLGATLDQGARLQPSPEKRLDEPVPGGLAGPTPR
jgi:hypothetical protein